MSSRSAYPRTYRARLLPGDHQDLVWDPGGGIGLSVLSSKPQDSSPVPLPHVQALPFPLGSKDLEVPSQHLNRQQGPRTWSPTIHPRVTPPSPWTLSRTSGLSDRPTDLFQTFPHGSPVGLLTGRFQIMPRGPCNPAGPQVSTQCSTCWIPTLT